MMAVLNKITKRKKKKSNYERKDKIPQLLPNLELWLCALHLKLHQKATGTDGEGKEKRYISYKEYQRTPLLVEYFS